MTISLEHAYTDGCARYRVTDIRYGGTFTFTTRPDGSVLGAQPPNDGWLYLTDSALDTARPAFSFVHHAGHYNHSEIVLAEGWR